MYINSILACSNFVGLYIVYKNMKYENKLIYNIFLIAVVCASFLHHLSETNQVNHNLQNTMYLFDKYGDQLRYVDMFIAYSFFIYIVWKIGVHKTKQFIYTNYHILFVALSSSALCDFVITDQQMLYLIFHLIWHILIYYIIYKITFLIPP